MKKFLVMSGLLAMGLASSAMGAESYKPLGCAWFFGSVGVGSCFSSDATTDGSKDSTRGTSDLTSKKEQNRKTLLEGALPFVAEALDSGKIAPPLADAMAELRTDDPVTAIHQIVSETAAQR